MRIFLLTSLDQKNTPPKIEFHYWVLLWNQSHFYPVILSMLNQQSTAIYGEMEKKMNSCPQD